LERLVDAKGEAERSWYDDIKENNRKAWKRLVMNFGKICPARQNANRAVDDFRVMVFRQKEEARTGTRMIDRGVMMSKARYFQWGQSVEGGSLSPEECAHNWKTWLETASWLRDHKGTKGCLRLRIATEDIVDFYNDKSKVNEVEFKSKEIKDPNLQKRQEALRRLDMGHRSMGKDEDEDTTDDEELKKAFSTTAQAMLAASERNSKDGHWGGAFVDSGLNAPIDIREFAKKGEKPAQSPQKPGEERADEGNDDKDKWFNKDQLVTKAVRTWRIGMKDLSSSATERL